MKLTATQRCKSCSEWPVRVRVVSEESSKRTIVDLLACLCPIVHLSRLHPRGKLLNLKCLTRIAHLRGRGGSSSIRFNWGAISRSPSGTRTRMYFRRKVFWWTIIRRAKIPLPRLTTFCSWKTHLLPKEEEKTSWAGEITRYVASTTKVHRLRPICRVRTPLAVGHRALIMPSRPSAQTIFEFLFWKRYEKWAVQNEPCTYKSFSSNQWWICWWSLSQILYHLSIISY